MRTTPQKKLHGWTPPSRKFSIIGISIFSLLFAGVGGYLIFSGHAQTPGTNLLPGEVLWNGVSNYIFGTNDTGEWSKPNFEFTNTQAAPGTINSVTQNLVKQGGFTLDRMFLPHHDFGTSKEMTDAEIQARINTATNTSEECLGTLVSITSTTPQSGDTMSDLDFDKHIVTLLDGNHPGYGKCNMFEIGNEFAAGPSSMTTYIQQWNTFVPALKAIRPDALFIGPVLPDYNSSIMRQFLQGANPAPDAISWHLYACGGSHSHLNDAEQCSKVVAGYITTESASVRQDIMATIGHPLPIGISEWSADNRANGSQNLAMQEPGMSDFISQALPAMAQANLDFANEFDMQSYAAYGGLDMIDSTNTPKPYFTAFTNLITQYKSASSTDTVPPTIPTNLQTTSITAASVSLSWTSSTDNVAVAGYKLYRNGTLDAYIPGSAITSYTDTGLSANTSYSYTISAYDAAGNESSQSSSVSATTPATAPTTVPGDCNGDGHVTVTDLSILLSHYGMNYPACDFSNSGTVTITDLSILLSHYGS
jgi:hypothetical protein